MSERWDGNMMTVEKERFGEFIRREREGKEIGLREMAKLIGVSATYLSKVERDEFAPPAEDKVRVIAAIIRCDTDDLLARAGRVSTDITDIIKRRPVELSALLRTANGLSAEDIAGLTRQGEYLSRKDAEIERQRAEIERLREENKEKQAAFHATHVERDDLRATIKRMREQLKDPNVVALNMLHGKIALPSVEQIKHIYQERFLPPDKATVVSERDEALEGKP